MKQLITLRFTIGYRFQCNCSVTEISFSDCCKQIIQNNGSEAAHKETAAEKKERDGGTKVLAQKKTETNMIRKAGAKRGEEVNLSTGKEKN